MLRKDNILKSLLFSFCLPSAILSITMALQIAVSFLSNKRHCFSPLSSLISLQETIKYLFLSRNTESSYQQKGKKKEISQQWRFFCTVFYFFLVGQQKKKEVPFSEMLSLIVRRRAWNQDKALILWECSHPKTHTSISHLLFLFSFPLFSCLSFSFCLFFFVFFFFLIK